MAVESRPVQRCRTSGAEGLGDVNGWRAPLRGSPPPTPTAVGEIPIFGVKSVSFIFYKIVYQWQPLSLLVFVKITKTTN